MRARLRDTINLTLVDCRIKIFLLESKEIIMANKIGDTRQRWELGEITAYKEN